MKKISDRQARVFAVFLFVGTLTGTMFLNCGKQSSETIPVETTANSSTTASATATPSPLSATVVPQEIVIGATAQVTGTGGQPPYTYSLTEANGTIDPNSGLMSGQTSYGSVGVVVTDADDATFSTSLIVSNPSLSTVGQCTLGAVTVPVGATITGYATATATCGGTCASQVMTCTGGVLSGQSSYPYATCAVTACAWMPSATACSPAVGTSPTLPCTKGTTYCYGSASGYSGGSYTSGTTGALYTCD